MTNISRMLAVAALAGARSVCSFEDHGDRLIVGVDLGSQEPLQLDKGPSSLDLDRIERAEMKRQERRIKVLMRNKRANS